MKISNTSERLKFIMRERGLKQVDILQLAKPYCSKYDVKLEKNDLSQYVSGKVEPGQHKLFILGLALNVNEAWLMGYDVPMDRETAFKYDVNNSGVTETNLIDKFNDDEKLHIKKYRTLDEYGKKMVDNALDIQYERCIENSTDIKTGEKTYPVYAVAYGGGNTNTEISESDLEKAQAIIKKLLNKQKGKRR